MSRLVSRIFHPPLLAAACLALSAACWSQQLPPVLSDGYPVGIEDDGEVIWVAADYKFGRGQKSEYFYKRWNPVSGAVKDLPMPTDFSAGMAVSTAAGTLFWGETAVYPAIDNPPRALLLLTPQGRSISLVPPLKRSGVRLLALADKSVLLVGGTLPDGKQRSAAVERVTAVDGKLQVERLPDVPGPPRGSYALVALADGRAMVLGGTDSQYVGCSKCLADTYLLDVKTKDWTVGPKMLEPRANASATLLPDGSVLVAGGWTPGHDWNETAARTTERWDARSDRFTPGPPLPLGVAMQQAVWAAGRKGRTLLLMGGMVAAWEGNHAIEALDVAGGEWRLAGEGCAASNKSGSLEAGPFLDHGAAYMWCREESSLRRYAVPLRLPADTQCAIAADGGHALRRGAIAFLASAGKAPLLAVGGDIGGAATAAVDAVWPDGGIRALAPLNHPRRAALAMRLADGGYLALGGSGGSPHDRVQPALATEWLAAGSDPVHARWQDLDAAFERDSVLGQLADGSLVEVRPTGWVELIGLAAGAGARPTLRRTPLPPLNRQRRSSYNGGESDRVVVRGLADGRIVVAGGAVQQHNIALLQEDSMQPDAADIYVGLGEFQPAQRYEIYDPATRSWRNSAPSIGMGGPVAILYDGRVVKIQPSRIVGDEKQDGSWPTEPGRLEISSADGQSWSDFGARTPPLVQLDSYARPFVAQGELFISGKRPDTNNGGPSMVQWFNAAAGRWETLWQAAPKDNYWHDHLGRVIVRDLANGKRVVLAVEGM